MTNGRKSSNLVKSHELIWHFIIVPSPSTALAISKEHKSKMAEALGPLGKMCLTFLTQIVGQDIENIREAKEELFSEIGAEVPNTLPIEIDEDLDCIVCYEPMGLNGASIYQCIEGHLICPKCYDSVRICPICRKPYERPPIRNRFAENFAKYNKCQTE